MPPRIFSKGLKIKTKKYLKDFKDTLDGQDGWGMLLDLLAGLGICTQQKEDTGLVQGEPPKILGGQVLTSQLA